jgi:hypothetical protein
MKHPTLIVIIILLMRSTVCFGQASQDAFALIDAGIANADANAKEALHYTFHENDSSIVPDIFGQPPTPRLPGTQWTIPVYMVNAEYRWSIQLDVLFIEGIPYRRLTGINGQKLSPELLKFESERYDNAVATIHSLSPQQRQQRLRSPEGNSSVFVDPKQFRSSYSCKMTGHEKVDKRPSTVIRCKPLRDAHKLDNPTQVSGDTTLWVDDQKPFFHRTRVVLDHTVAQYGRGTVFTDTWSLIDGVWHETSAELNWVGSETINKNLDIPTPGPRINVDQANQGKTVDTFSNFKKFRTESRIITP